MIKKISSFVIPALVLMPALVFAQSDGVNRLIDQVQNLVARLIPIVIGLALLVFLWGVLRYLFSKEDTEKGQAKSFMLWGIITLFVMVSVWGLVQIVSDTVFGTGGPREIVPSIPRVPGS